MMNQQINLYQDRFKDIQPLMSARHGATILAGTLVVLIISSFWYHDHHASRLQTYDTNVQLKQQAADELEVLRKELQTRLADTQIKTQLQQVSEDIEVRKRMIDFVSNNQFGAGEGFAENLSEIAKVEFSTIWLNEISLQDDYVRLSGSALNAENVPQYFQQIQSRELFEGRVFDIFELDRSRSAEWKVDFIIASREASNE